MKATVALAFGVGLIATAWLMMRGQAADFNRTYLFGFIFWSDIPIGCLGLVMIFHLTGGRWGELTRPLLEVGASTFLGIAVLSLPILLQICSIYPWGDGQLAVHKRSYLNPWFFALRTICYFALWATLQFRLRFWANREKEDRLTRLSAIGLITFCFSVTFAAIDWQMSTEPDWHSSVYGLVFLAGQALTAYCFILGTFLWTVSTQNRVPPKQTLRDLGNILLTLVMFWTYLSFVQYLIVWSGNLPAEVTWYLRRTTHGWQWIALVIFVCQFALPFAFLLFRSVKENPKAMIALCILIFVIRILDHYWMLLPAFGYGPLTWALPSSATYIGLGAIWTANFAHQLGKSNYE